LIFEIFGTEFSFYFGAVVSISHYLAFSCPRNFLPPLLNASQASNKSFGFFERCLMGFLRHKWEGLDEKSEGISRIPAAYPLLAMLSNATHIRLFLVKLPPGRA
jgi:hypothetical protein